MTMQEEIGTAAGSIWRALIVMKSSEI